MFLKSAGVFLLSGFGSIGALQIYILVTKDNSPCTGPQEKAAPRDISDKMPGI